jgi:hypothetical protein
MENQLVKIVTESGLEQTKAQVLLTNFQNYFEIAAEWELKINSLNVTDISQKAEMKMASEARKFLKQKRIDVETTRKTLKEQSLREGQTIDSIAKILKNLIEPLEDKAESIEKFAEIQEAKRKAELKEEREKEIQPFAEFVPFGIDLSNLNEDDYSKLLNGCKLQLQAKFEAEQKEEKERIEKEKKQELFSERKLKLAEFMQFYNPENPDFIVLTSETTEQEFIFILNNCKKLKSEYEAKQELIRKENERLKIEAEAKEKELEAERKKKEDEIKKIEAENKKKLDAERKEKEKIEAELKAKQLAELKAKQEQEAKEKAELEAKKKANKAPDKEKLKVWINSFKSDNAPNLSSDESKAICVEITNKFNAFTKWAETLASNL